MEYENEPETDQMNGGSLSSAMLNNLPAWCRDEKYQRYWHHYNNIKGWFHQYSKTGQACTSDPIFQQYATSQAQNSSYWMYYHYYNMMMWYQRWQQSSQRQYQIDVNNYQRKMYDDRCAMPPPRNTFVPNSRRQRQSHNSESSASSECAPERKRSKHHTLSKQMEKTVTKERVTDIVLDLDPSVFKEEEEVIECHMEITDEMLEFFAQSARHRQERDAQKTEAEKEENRQKYIDISKANSGAALATTEAPKERPGSKRTQEMKMLYGKGAAMIHGMETAMQLTFDRYVDLNQPTLWPHLPLNIKFD